jgi:hypothetical protein
MNSAIPSLHSFDGHYGSMRQVPPSREGNQRAMRRRVSGSKQQKGAECDEETEKHWLSFIMHIHKPIRVP